MARQRPPDRLDRLVECAVRVFTERGYRRAQMADIAQALGVAPGTTQYLERRTAQGHLRRLPHPAVAARLIDETVAWFAMHRHSDPDAAGITSATTEDTVADILVHGFAEP